MDWTDAISQARERISPHILNTPLYSSPYLSKKNEGQVWLKLESEQYTGSFKARGALNKILKLSAEEKAPGLITASTGNHAQGFARALSISGDKGTIFLPKNAAPAKVEALRHYEVQLEFYGEACLETELHAKAIAEKEGRVWVSPYNDPDIIAGQGTIASEITEALPKVDVVLACIGGGGLMSGLSSWFKTHSPKTKLIGCLPENSPEMYLSVEKGEVVIIDEPQDTLSDGSAGGLESESITFDICRQNVDEYILVSEDQIASAITFMVTKHHKIIEGAAGVAIASFMKDAKRFKGLNVVIVVCGSNISTEKLREILNEAS
ncbi:MAG: threonine/serine dehydratase [Planctomycetota bacterium]|nr:threonine/serine dehydratase [Planctomycetota bacterium]